VEPDRELTRDEKVARAWTLHGQRWSSREIGAELGVSHVTAQAWVQEARLAAEWSEVTERAGKRARMGEFLNQLARIGVDRLQAVDEDGQPLEKWKDVVPGLMSVVREINLVEGNHAPLKVSTDDRRPPDPGLIAAMEAEARRAEALDAAEQARELEE
jgi:hypothetical protein